MAGVVGAALMTAGPQAQAQSVADFYRGKTISLVIGTSAGNDYDLYSVSALPDTLKLNLPLIGCPSSAKVLQVTS